MNASKPCTGNVGFVVNNLTIFCVVELLYNWITCFIYFIDSSLVYHSLIIQPIGPKIGILAFHLCTSFMTFEGQKIVLTDKVFLIKVVIKVSFHNCKFFFQTIGSKCDEIRERK